MTEVSLSRARWRGRLAALVAGSLPLFVFPETSWWWLAWVVLTPLLVAVARAPTRREAGIRAWLGGAGFVVAMAHYTLPQLGPALLLLAAAVGLVWLPWGRAAHRLLAAPRRPRDLAAAVLVLPSGWVLIEFVRSWEHLGGPGMLLGASQWNSPATLAAAALGGVWLVSFLAAGSSTAVAFAAAPGLSARHRGFALGLAAGFVLVGPVWHVVRPEPTVHDTVRVALAQPGQLPRGELRLAAGIAATRDAAAEPTGPGDTPDAATHPRGAAAIDLVVWGESSVTFDLDVDTAIEARLRELAAEIGAPLLVNVDARRTDEGGIFKSSVLVTADGVAGRYDKMRLVPFGEYIPLRSAFGWIAGVSEAADEDRRRGDGLRVLDAGAVRVGPVVSFELTFPDMSRHLARMGSELIAVQSMTSTFQESWAPAQVGSIAAVRAVEAGRSVVYATMSGVSAAFDARGRQLGWLGTDDRGALVVDVPVTTGRTLYVRTGDWVPLASAGVVVVALGTAWSRRRFGARTGISDHNGLRTDT